MDNSEIYNFLKIVCDVIMISLIKTLIVQSSKQNKFQKIVFLLSCSLLIILNIMGIYRNSYTLWEYRDYMSYFWLGSDIFQLIYCVMIYMIVLFNDKLNKLAKIIIISLSFIFLVLNMYNFLVNFKWYDYEPFSVFIFWFINNLMMILFSFSVIYIVFSNKLRRLS
jgi:hypothetical protein